MANTANHETLVSGLELSSQKTGCLYNAALSLFFQRGEELGLVVENIGSPGENQARRIIAQVTPDDTDIIEGENERNWTAAEYFDTDKLAVHLIIYSDDPGLTAYPSAIQLKIQGWERPRDGFGGTIQNGDKVVKPNKGWGITDLQRAAVDWQTRQGFSLVGKWAREGRLLPLSMSYEDFLLNMRSNKLE